MNHRQSLHWLAVLLLAAAGPAFAANQEVMVGTGAANMQFSPATVTINVGEHVTFKNSGLGGPHNVVADDASFRCSNGCDGAGGNGNISSALWSATVTFNHAGTFHYYCQDHGAPGGIGMAGQVIVNDVAPPPPTQPIVGGISGNWFNPSANQGGYGFQIEVLPNNGLLAIWFVFNPAGTAQNWLFSQGSYTPGSSDVVLPVFLEQGGAFPPNFNGANITAPAWGSLELKFTDCNNGTAEYTPNEAAVNAQYGHLQFPIQRVTSIAGATCP